MWVYMASFYLEASLETRKRRRPYLIASLIILILSSAAAVLDGMNAYTVLLDSSSGPDNAESAAMIIGAGFERWLRPAGLIWDTALRVCDAVLVSNLRVHWNGGLDWRAPCNQLYRCYIVWAGQPWVVVVPICMFLAGIGTLSPLVPT
jgi:hypothetical protein